MPSVYFGILYYSKEYNSKATKLKGGVKLLYSQILELGMVKQNNYEFKFTLGYMPLKKKKLMC